MYPIDPFHADPESFLRLHASERDRLMRRRRPAARILARRRAPRRAATDGWR